MRVFDGDSLDEMFDAPTTPATINVTTKRCYRHKWEVIGADPYVVGMETSFTICCLCGKVRDEEAKARNRRNRQRGSAFELKVAKALGGRKTGPLGGRDDVMVGQFAAVQTKKTQRFSLAEARVYLADLRRTFPDRVPLVVHALPGHAADPVVILPLDVWVELHGADVA